MNLESNLKHTPQSPICDLSYLSALANRQAKVCPSWWSNWNPQIRALLGQVFKVIRHMQDQSGDDELELLQIHWDCFVIRCKENPSGPQLRVSGKTCFLLCCLACVPEDLQYVLWDIGTDLVVR